MVLKTPVSFIQCCALYYIFPCAPGVLEGIYTSEQNACEMHESISMLRTATAVMAEFNH